MRHTDLSVRGVYWLAACAFSLGNAKEKAVRPTDWDLRQVFWCDSLWEVKRPNTFAWLMNPPVADEAAPPSGLARFKSAALVGGDIILAVLMVGAGWLACELGIFFKGVFVFAFFLAPIRLTITLRRLIGRKGEFGGWRIRLGPHLRRHRWQILNHWLFWLLAGWVLEICIVPLQFSSEQYAATRVLYWGAIGLLLLTALLPGKRFHLATNLAFAIGSIFMLAQITRIYWPEPKSKGVVISAPFWGDWVVIQGGPSLLINHHYGFASQRDALDLERVSEGHVQLSADRALDASASWGQVLYAPADGRVTECVSNLDDNEIGQTDESEPAGNHLVIDIGSGHFVVMAHLQKESTRVHTGEFVHLGEPVAKCGNSGNTSGPHLHLQVQDQSKFRYDGVTTSPILFRNVTVLRGGRHRTDAPFFVRRNDRIATGNVP